MNDSYPQVELPTLSSTRSYWHRDPSETLMGHRTTTHIPGHADVVVIGSGITGTFAAQTLVADGREVLMLEAREACWGATGRNGGHCQPAVWDSTPEVARFELETYDFIQELIKNHHIACDWNVVGGVHAIYSVDVLAAARRQRDRLQGYPDLRDKAFLIEDPSKLAALHIPKAIAAVYQPKAAQFWPYKLVAHLLENLLQEDPNIKFNLQTHTPVVSIERSQTEWIVNTDRGRVYAQHVLLATNAYSSHLLDSMTGLIVPVRGQVCALKPPLPDFQLPHSYVWMKSADAQYVIHRGADDTQVQDGYDDDSISEDRSLIFGGERLATEGGEEGISRDDQINPIVSQNLRRGILDAIKLHPECSDAASPPPLHASHEWTGIMGYSRDSSPWVGEVPASMFRDRVADNNSMVRGVSGDEGFTNLWISAGYTGHGMLVAARCGIAVGEMIQRKLSTVTLPEHWVVSEERGERAKKMKIPKTTGEFICTMPADETESDNLSFYH
ncbi:FAD dependent oxidoreductase [Dactylonectria estremocensis]|uniref:FAD dependent oxidoreductase n=1 Tax=Dactylonectria estremocensis TaxID=1079267 RepID=A0A9P9IHK6_9HYPO|nr:FAD dependent oxidoreductase [Dactylonectria estremocensis]